VNRPSSYDWAARLLLSAGALLPYLPLLSLTKIFITDDGFTSDIFNGELPLRVLAGNLVASGQAPVWSSNICSGFPLEAAAPVEPVSLAMFATLPIAPALSVFLIIMILVAAHGAYGLARRLGADRAGAMLAGIAFAGSGYLVTQLKHLSVIATVVWLPWGLLLLDRALAPHPPGGIDGATAPRPQPPVAARWLSLGLFGVVLAEQIVSGFVQSVYICGVVYGVWAMAQLLRFPGRIGRLPARLVLGGGLVLACGLAVAAGAVVLLPLSDLSQVSDRRAQLDWGMASMLPYSWSDALNFLIPYANGDVSDGSYRAAGLFWENYGYLGAATFLLAIWGAVRGIKRPRTRLCLGIILGAFLMVLGPRTPVFHLAWQYFPGMGRFRFPTRFLVVVDLGLALLAAQGLGLLTRDLKQSLARLAPRVPDLLAAALCLGTALDLFAIQSRQNPFVSAQKWLTPPPHVQAIAGTGARTYAPLHYQFHRMAFWAARGWSDLTPYWILRDTAAPNLGLFWGLPSADCYFGLAPSWYVDVWGDHIRPGRLVSHLMQSVSGQIVVAEGFARVLETYGVTHVLSPVPVVGAQFSPPLQPGAPWVYPLNGRRVRVVRTGRAVLSNEAAAQLLTAKGFDPDETVFLHGDSALGASAMNPTLAWSNGAPGVARILAETSRMLRLHVEAPSGGYLLVADTFYPGWQVTIDGQPAPILRANISSRAVALPVGEHEVQFSYPATRFFLGVKVTAIGLALLMLWIGTAAVLLVRKTIKPKAA
jgi:hypothetical protein